MKYVLDKAIMLAIKAHSGQTDLAGMPYILHPLHIMEQLETIEEKIVAILHDVTEDSDMTLEEVMINITDDYNLVDETEMYYIRKSLFLLDKNNFKNYKLMIQKIVIFDLARKVKIADLEHNMDLKRIIGKENMTEKDMKRVRKYMKAWSYLTN